ncbi:MAG: adoK [Chloroflexi bacterium]|jgi:adenosine kinase|nr:adoK [Chloroflexota bacterium]MEA2617680.1 adenosine kinase [Chloroflexota bacterium]
MPDDMPRIAVTGSVAYDTIMVFPGRFGEHILPDKTHILNVSFLVDRLERRRGGTAANIAYTLALLGERPLLCAAVGDDFDAYGAALEEAGVDTSTALRCDDVATASCFITTDLDDNQITAFFPGAMARAGAIDLRRPGAAVDTVVVAPDAPEAMAVHIAQATELGHRLVFAPAQQIPSLSEEALRAGLEAAWMVVGNDYELEMLRSRTGLGVEELRAHGALVALTLGGRGSRLHSGDGVVEVPVAAVEEVVDPTGAGDAYLAGLLAGLRRGYDLGRAGRMGALAAAYVVEVRGPQAHHFSPEAFAERYRSSFAELLPT